MPFIMPARNGAFVLFEQDIPTAPLLRASSSALNAGRPAERPRHAVPLRAARDRRRAHGVPAPQPLRRRQPALRPARHLARVQRQAAAASATRRSSRRRSSSGPTSRCRRWSTACSPCSAKAAPAARPPPTARSRASSGCPGPLLRARGARAARARRLEPAARRAHQGRPALRVGVRRQPGQRRPRRRVSTTSTTTAPCPIFVTMGRVHRTPLVRDDGAVGSHEVFTLRYTYDERVEDGFYAARALERLAALPRRPRASSAPARDDRAARALAHRLGGRLRVAERAAPERRCELLAPWRAASAPRRRRSRRPARRGAPSPATMPPDRRRRIAAVARGEPFSDERLEPVDAGRGARAEHRPSARRCA